MGQFATLVEAKKTLAEIAAYLDGLSHAHRLEELKSFPASLQKQLYEKASADLTVSDLIPAGTPLREVIFYGKNTLPVFSNFQKRMCLTPDGQALAGYNHQTMGWVTGPGYFVVKDNSDRPGEVMVDYTVLPPSKPETWPGIKSNESGITKLVYGGMKDYLRRVSKNVFIGEATKQGKRIGQYFILCRE